VAEIHVFCEQRHAGVRNARPLDHHPTAPRFLLFELAPDIHRLWDQEQLGHQQRQQLFGVRPLQQDGVPFVPRLQESVRACVGGRHHRRRWVEQLREPRTIVLRLEPDRVHSERRAEFLVLLVRSFRLQLDGHKEEEASQIVFGAEGDRFMFGVFFSREVDVLGLRSLIHVVSYG